MTEWLKIHSTKDCSKMQKKKKKQKNLFQTDKSPPI